MVTLRGVISVACVAVLGSAVFSAQEIPRKGLKNAVPVEADIVKYVKVGGRVVSSSGRYYRASDGRVREDAGRTSVVIDLRTRTVTRLNHEAKEAQVIAVPAATTPESSASRPIRFAAGMHEGLRITKSRMQGHDGGKLEVWTADDFGLVVMVRTESANVVTTRFLRNIALRDPNSSLFAVPIGYAISTRALSDAAALPQSEASSLLSLGEGSPEKTSRR